ncbi:MAG: bifunctional 2-C-methyl-D-erythritol 4-phosphate cytidylyltransferase/2-C-methyl-D-erythritol 2,4-cyclodiphosphate synthase [Devosiaceae bacterium]|nr:bifunctional 2-C-methyl-D-erythritol 4-phosphate cytidylyltransferase/2-C-methyl-D-erythritol 2,4-cyclodiphosphate synthase [Devosiaceae bacterium]
MEKPSKLKIGIIVAAAGSGTRAARHSEDLPKQYRRIDGVAVLARTINALLDMNIIDWVLPVIGADHKDFYQQLKLENNKLLPPVTGGKDRQTSSLAGLEALKSQNPDLVLIHDGARPFVTKDLVERVCDALTKQKNSNTTTGILPAVNPTDAIKTSPDGKNIEKALDREKLWAAQTPQGFYFNQILKAHQKAKNHPDRFSDDSALAEWAGLKVNLLEGEPDNFKITINSDFLRAEAMLNQNRITKTQMETRVGSGLDIHQFEPGNSVRLGGIEIPHDRSLKGHSDADAALHVLTDALLGALAEGDIGTHFPPSENKWKGEPSDTFLRFAADRIAKRGGRIVHLDLTIICEKPKITPHAKKMRQNIANICSIDVGRISIKATTSESMGFIGRGEGLMAMASATIEIPRVDDLEKIDVS